MTRRSLHSGDYAIVVALFTGVLIISNVVAVKLISFGPFTVDGGVFLFPLVYILGDVLAEVYGFKASRRAIFAGFALAIIASLTILLVQVSPAAPEWEFQESYEHVLGFVPRIVAASLAGYLAGQLINAWLLVRLRDRALARGNTSGGWLSQLWFRLISSTMVGQLADTVVFCTIAFYGTLLGWTFFGYVALGYGIKVLAEVILLPITTTVIRWIRRREETAHETMLEPAR